MADRLVLGSGPLGQRLAAQLQDRPGELCVVTADEDHAETLLSQGVTVITGNPASTDTLSQMSAPEVVIVAGDDPGMNVSACRAVREVFPGSFLVAYAGWDGQEWVGKLSAVADRVIDPRAETTAVIMDRVGEGALRLQQLQRVLRSIDTLAIVTHDNPDPDAIASAVALSRVAERVGCEADVCYYGEITHQENRAFVNLLSFDLRNLAPGDDISKYDGIALVDHSRPGVNDQLPVDMDVDVVIDHHPPRAPVEARFVDLRSEVGATSTLLVDYLEHFNIPFTEDVATGLLFGIRVDTKEFTRETSEADFAAAATLLPHADLGVLEQIETPTISPTTFETIADAISNRVHEGQAVLSCVGRLSDRDALAQAAERLLMLEGISTTVVSGFREGTIYVSARSRGTDVDLGETLRDAFGAIGSAGGHADMAGAQITMGVLEAVDDFDESLREVVEAVVRDRFLDALDARSSQTVAGVYAPDHDAAEFLVSDAELHEAIDESADVCDGGNDDADTDV